MKVSSPFLFLLAALIAVSIALLGHEDSTLQFLQAPLVILTFAMFYLLDIARRK